VPELPEVEVVRAGLEPAVSGATIDSVTVFDDRSLRRHLGPSEDFVERLTGRTILAAVRRGKFLWMPLSPSSPPKTQDIRHETDPTSANAAVGGESPAYSVVAEALVVHLGMSGQVLLRDVGRADDALLRIRLDIDSPASGPLRVDFVDQRVFGSMAIDHVLPTPDGRAAGFGDDAVLIPSQVAHIARDPLDPAFDDGRFFGIGNIYADEALWAARIHYDQPTETLTRARARRLLAEARLVLGKALAEGGTSFDAQYVNVNGASGYFSHSLNAYGQQGEGCPRCGRAIIRESFMNRGSHFCPFCQRLRAG
jgi:formamidopyrimidine-DNA glycosylase